MISIRDLRLVYRYLARDKDGDWYMYRVQPHTEDITDTWQVNRGGAILLQDKDTTISSSSRRLNWEDSLHVYHSKTKTYVSVHSYEEPAPPKKKKKVPKRQRLRVVETKVEL